METITFAQQVTATLGGVDSKDNPAPLVGVPVWSSSDPSILTVSPAADGMTAVCVAAGKIGTATVNVVATPMQPDGSAGALISGSAQVSVTGTGASRLVISFGAPTAQTGAIPAPPPPPPPPPAPVG